MISDVKEKIKKLKIEKNAVILAHYYVSEEVQEIADYIGDSYYLAKIAKQSSADIIVFCGVSFMGESAKVLNPNKKVLMPDMNADCPMAHMATKEKIESMRKQYDDLAVVCYINSTAALKCMSDVCVTSSNAVKIVRSLPNKNIFFIPDKNLGSYVAKQVPEKNIIINDGYCPIHAAISLNEVLAEKENHPSAKILSHPECEREILEVSDFIGSTADIIKYVAQSCDKDFIICTEDGVLYELRMENPEKKFYFPMTRPVCLDMKLITLDKVREVLENETNAVEVLENVRKGAILPLEKMLELAK